MTSSSDIEAQKMAEEAEQNRLDDIEATAGAEDIDAPTGETGEDAQPKPAEPEKEEPRVINMSPADQARASIASRFKREDGRVPFDGDMNKPENLYGDVARETLEPDPNAPEPGVPHGPTAAADATKPAPSQKTYTLTIRGKPVTMTEEELLDRAMKVEAADSYLDEARDIMEQAKQVRAERAGRAASHRPDDSETGTHDDELDDGTPPDESRRPGTDLKSVVEKLQFGDPEEAAAELSKVIEQVAAKQADEGHLKRLMQNDIARSQKALKQFTDANPDLANDRLASVAIENTVYDVFKEEIMAQGIDEDKLPKDPKQLADWHRFYRINGAQVSNATQVLEKAKERFLTWRGTPSSPKQAPKPQHGAPRIDVNVNRTQRREAIPIQPTRAAAPRRDATPPKVKSRSDVIADMRRSRGQVTT